MLLIAKGIPFRISEVLGQTLTFKEPIQWHSQRVGLLKYWTHSAPGAEGGYHQKAVQKKSS